MNLCSTWNTKRHMFHVEHVVKISSRKQMLHVEHFASEPSRLGWECLFLIFGDVMPWDA